MNDERSLSERIEAVSDAEADGEQLVTVSVRPEESVEETRRRVEAEVAEAEYLDVDEEVRRPLKRAMEEAKRVLNEYDETPANGLAVYTGVVGADLVTYVFDDLPDPVAASVYEHANEFDTDPLAPSVPGTDAYGLLVVGREAAVLGRYDGTDIDVVETVESDVPSKQAATGRNEDRFEGRSDERRKEFFDAVGDAAGRAFLDAAATGDVDREPSVSGLVLGGSEVIVETFRDGDHLPEPLADALVGPFDVEYATETGLRELVDAAEGAGAFEATDARDALDRFFDALDGDEPAVGGREDVDRALERDAVETLLLLDSLPPEDAQALEERAAEAGSDVVVVPSDLDRAERVDEAFDGVGALLRFPME
ncbi:Vms1/Ankzf1 family peptidyl-tRNA hydrolase [Haloplanus halophilus]|uniref:baeRF10 domain-containing protein n=1 Tax=Haloplanus halophilus TaxID=2949993 RepID=UPI00203B4A43|nr:Vms1/Ankzf1 family peptidyl-tRNA hydrolase [Haloplanus sp. GDY1]